MTGVRKSVIFFLLALPLIAKAAADEPGPTPTQVREMIKNGDALAIPILVNWLNRGLGVGFNSMTDERFQVALEGVAKFQLDECGPTLVTIFRRADTNAATQNQIAYATSQIASPGSRKFLLEVLRDTTISPKARTSAAVALTRMGEESGRDFLFERYKNFLVEMTTKSQWNVDVRKQLEGLYDVELMSKLERIVDEQADTRARNNITTLLERMEINHFSTDELFKLAENTDWSQGAYKRYPAIEALGEKGTPEMIDRIQAIKPWDAAGPGSSALQQRFIDEHKAAAISRIRQRYARAAERP